MTINLFQPPYYDDFYDSVDNLGQPIHTKGFSQIAYKPGYAVQARELTQMQSILKDQIAKFGSHVFKHGSVVIPGNSMYELNLAYIVISGLGYNANYLLNKRINCTSTGVIAFVKKVVVTSVITLYIQYIHSGPSTDVFSVEDRLISDSVETTTNFIVEETGPASLAYINEGVFFVNGFFTRVNSQSVVIDHSSTPTKSVRLKISEYIIDSEMDSSLLDPAQGTNNYSAPGADRVVIDLTLVTADVDDLSSSFIELMKFENGILKEFLRYAKYNELEKFMARRTYDESGNYVVNGLKVKVREHLISNNNGGVYPPLAGAWPNPIDDASKLLFAEYLKKYGNANYLAVEVSPGKAYVSGFELDKISTTFLPIAKSRGYITNKVTPQANYGQYFYVTGFNATNRGLPNISKMQTIYFYNHTAATPTNSGTNWSNDHGQIATANLLFIDLHEFDATTPNNSIYKLYISNLSLTAGKNITDLGKVYFRTLDQDVNTSAGQTCSCNILHKYSIATLNGIDFAAGQVITSTSATASVHTYKPGTLYVTKHTTSPIPKLSNTITVITGPAPTGATAGTEPKASITSAESLVVSSGGNLLVPLKTDSVKSIRITPSGNNDVDISYKTAVVLSANASVGPTYTATFSATTGIVDSIDSGSLIIYNHTQGKILSNTLAISISSSSFKVQSTLNTDLNTNDAIQVVYTCLKSTGSNSYKTKTAVEDTLNVVFSSTNSIDLGHADVYDVVSVKVGSVDYSTSFTFDNGQRDFYYQNSTLKYIPNTPKPADGVTLEVVCSYMQHSGTGDYFCIDSYISTGFDPYVSGALQYTSPDTGQIYDLSQYIDFRSIYTVDSQIFPVVPDSNISTTVHKFIPRIDSVVCGLNNDIFIAGGISAENPKAPNVPDGHIHLADLYIPAYTINAANVTVKRINNRVYTMYDVGVIDRRIAEIENFVTLSQLENSSINYDIVDTNTGLSRFKSGYLIDSFKNIDAIADVYNKDFKVSYVSETIVPQFEYFECEFSQASSFENTVQLSGGTGGYLSLPYDEVVFARQRLSSKETNVNPYALISWVGKMEVIPATDYWVEVIDLPNIINNYTQTIQTDVYTGIVTRFGVIPATLPVTVSPLEQAKLWFGTATTVNLTAPHPIPTLPPQPNPITLELARTLHTGLGANTNITTPHN